MKLSGQGALLTKSSEITSQVHLTGVPEFPGVIGTFMGRDALSLAASYLGLGSNDCVLLPVYTCQEVIRAFMARAQVIFYDVRPDLTITPDEVRARLQGCRVKMMLITHYFGFLQPYRYELKQICEEKNICLIEDCAHSLLTQGSGDTGDLAVYSFRKILPLRDGGGLKVNHGTEPPAPAFFPRIYSNVLSTAVLAKRFLNIHGSKFSRGQVGNHIGLTRDKPSGDNDRILPLSSFAQQKLPRISIAEVMRKRREDFLFWLGFSNEKCTSLDPVYSGLPQGVCPFGFPVRIEGRTAIEAKSRKAGVVLGVHWRLSPDLAPDCGSSHALSASLLTLPLYPELNEKSRNTLVKILAA